MKGLFLIVLAVTVVFASVFAEDASASVLDKASEEIKSVGTSLENARSTLKQAEKSIDSVLSVFRFVEEKVKLLYNFESFANKVYYGVLNWSQGTLKWIGEEKIEEAKKLNYECNNCYTHI